MREIAQPPASCEAETSKESIKTKTESGNCFCIPVVYIQYREREKEKVGDRPAKLNEKKRDRELEGKKTYTLRVQQFWTGRQKTSKATHKKLPQRGGPLYISPCFSGERSPGTSAKLARDGATDSRDGEMLPPCVPRDYNAPQSLCAGLCSSVKRDKISPVLQTTYNSQMWSGRLDTISFDRVSSMRTAKIPHPLVRNPPIRKIPGFVPADKPRPEHRLVFVIHAGLRLFLKLH